MTVAFKTFGCRLNRAEALDLEARYVAAGYDVVPLEGTVPSSSGTVPVPDVIVVRGCSVTARAQRDCEKEIERLRHLFPGTRIQVTGCLPEKGTVPLELGTVPTQSVRPMGTDPLPAVGTVPVPMSTSRAYLKIQDGCSGKCAFCIVPQFRGRPVSVPFGDVLAHARAFLDAGYRELVVTGCNLALYRSEGHGLADLLSALAGMGTVPSHRVRLGSLEPGICDTAVLDAFDAHPNICRFIHLSLQSGSDTVLRRMNRPYAIGTVARFCAEAVRRLGPRLSLGADVIAGFPGETDPDHVLTRAILSGNFASTPPSASSIQPPPTPDAPPFSFTNLHVFPYSERPGTPAATMDGALPRAVRLARARDLEQLGRTQRAAFARTFVGQTVEVCVEKDGLHGWTSEYLACKLKGPAARRSLVSVVVDHVDGDTLIARA